MTKANILQILALLLLLLGAYLLYEVLANEEANNAGVLMGIGPIIMAVSLFIISKSKAISK